MTEETELRKLPNGDEVFARRGAILEGPGVVTVLASLQPASCECDSCASDCSSCEDCNGDCSTCGEG